MGGQTSSTPQMPVPMANNMPLAALFMNNGGYGGQQTPIPQIQAPAYPTPTWTPQQAQAQTVAAMNALRPPVSASQPQPKQSTPFMRYGGANR